MNKRHLWRTNLLLHVAITDRRQVMILKQDIEGAYKRGIPDDDQINLKNLCQLSAWNQSGRRDLVENLSNTILNGTEIQALSFGLKFATGHCNADLADVLSRNHRINDPSFEKGFIQGLITRPPRFYTFFTSETSTGLEKFDFVH